MNRLRRFLRPLDAKLILALAALIVTATVCYGFVQRGDHISSAERSVEQLTAQVDQLLDENGRLHDQLTRIERRSMRREHIAAEDRDALARELLRLTEWLRANGIRVPTSTYRPPSPSRPAPVSSHGGGQSHASNGPKQHHGGGSADLPGNSDGHSQGHGQGNGGGKGHRGTTIDLPGDLPDLRIP